MHKLAACLGVSIDYLSDDTVSDPAYGLEEQSYCLTAMLSGSRISSRSNRIPNTFEQSYYQVQQGFIEIMGKLYQLFHIHQTVKKSKHFSWDCGRC